MNAASVELHQARHDQVREELTKLELIFIPEDEATLLISEDILLNAPSP